MTLRIGLGALIVEEPTPWVRETLRRFVRDKDGGHYEPLYAPGANGSLVTMPGFAPRIIQHMRKGQLPITIVDECRRLPKPLVQDALSDYDACWHPMIRQALPHGGVVSIPEMFGNHKMMAAILKAYPSQTLKDRSTPLSVVATPDVAAMRKAVVALRQAMPNREIGFVNNRRCVDSDDIIVATYSKLSAIPLRDIGVFIADDIEKLAQQYTSCAESISAIVNAVRYAIHTTAAGERPLDDMALEGLFGPSVALATYDDAVRAGLVAPVTVCWLPAPAPSYAGYGPFALIEAHAMQENEKFINMVASVCSRIDSHEFFCYADLPAVRDRLAGKLGESPKVSNHIVSDDSIEPRPIMVLATGKGCCAIKHLPWKKMTKESDRAYIVDFGHPWDVHNGQRGWLSRNDMARAHKYQELGFHQMFLNSIDQLPFGA